MYKHTSVGNICNSVTSFLQA